MLEKTVILGWRCTFIEAPAADYAVYDDGNLQPLAGILPTATESHGGFYEHSFLWLTIQALPAEQQQAIGKFLRPKDFDGELATVLFQADSEDIYRVLTYLNRVKAGHN